MNSLTSEPIIDAVCLVCLDKAVPAIADLNFHHRKTFAAQWCVSDAIQPSIQAEGRYAHPIFILGRP